MRNFLATKDFESIRNALSLNPALANEGVPYDDNNMAQAHPLHRICDGVFSGIYTDAEAVELAKWFLAHGADVNGNHPAPGNDSPLTAASSLHADLVAILYMAHGANIHHAGAHGGTALHWAAWCGRDHLVEKLIEAGAEIDKLCIDFKSTPLFWAVHSLNNGVQNGLSHYVRCVQLLVQAGADTGQPNGSGKTVYDLLDNQDHEIREAFGNNPTA